MLSFPSPHWEVSRARVPSLRRSPPQEFLGVTSCHGRCSWCHGFHCLLFLRLFNFCSLFAMALALGNRAGRIFGLRRAVFGSWLQSRLSTSAMLSQTSKSLSESNSKIYEMRTYYVKPKAFGKEKKNNALTILWVLFQGKYPTSLNWCWWSFFPSPPPPLQTLWCSWGRRGTPPPETFIPSF